MALKLWALRDLCRHPGAPLVRDFTSWFTINGPRGEYIVYVHSPLGSSLRTMQLRMDNEIFPLKFAKPAVRELIKPIAFLHEHANIIHTGKAKFPPVSLPSQSLHPR